MIRNASANATKSQRWADSLRLAFASRSIVNVTGSVPLAAVIPVATAAASISSEPTSV